MDLADSPVSSRGGPPPADAGSELDTARPGGLPPILRPLYDPLALIQGECTEERQDALTHGAGQVQVRLVEHLHQGSTGSDALNDLDTVEHRSRRPIPFWQYQHVARTERRDRPLKLGTTHRALTRGLLLENALAALRDQRPELPIQVLMLRRDARIADFLHEHPPTFETDFLTTEMLGFPSAFQVVTQS